MVESHNKNGKEQNTENSPEQSSYWKEGKGMTKEARRKSAE